MPACVDKTVEDRRDHLLKQLESCRKQRDSADEANKRVWTETIDYLLTLVMELDLEDPDSKDNT
jgi:hypothetical protein